MTEPTRDLGSGGMSLAYCSAGQARRLRLTRATDVWGWALTVLEMLLGRRAWDCGLDGPAALGELRQGAAARLGCALSVVGELADLLERCLLQDPGRRWTDWEAIEGRLEAIHRSLSGGGSIRGRRRDRRSLGG